PWCCDPVPHPRPRPKRTRSEATMDELVRTIPWSKDKSSDLLPLLEREWLVTNGLGGYASGTIAGAATRRSHGLPIAAPPGPLGCVMMLTHLLTEQFRFKDWQTVTGGGSEKVGRTLEVQGADVLSSFRLEMGLPVWRYEARGHVLEKRVYMP